MTTKPRQTNAPAAAWPTHGGVREEASLVGSGQFADATGLYVEDIPSSGGLPPYTEIFALLNRLQDGLDTRHNWDRLRIKAFADLVQGKITNKPAELRQISIASTGAGSYRIPRSHAALGGDKSNAYVSSPTRYSVDGGATWVTGGMTFNVTLQTVTFTAPPANGATITLEASVIPYQGIGTTTDTYEILSVSPHIYVLTGGSGTNITGDDNTGYAELVLAKLPMNDYQQYFDTGLVKHDEWYTRQNVPTPEIAGSNHAEKSFVAVPLATMAGPAAVLPGMFVKASNPNSRTRGLGYAMDAGSNPVARALGRALTSSIPRVTAWPWLVRRDRDGLVLLAVCTDAYRGSSTTTALTTSNTAAFDVFPLNEVIYV